MSQDKNKLNETTRQNDERPSDTPLPDGVGAAGVLAFPHTRLRRLLQATSDIMVKPLSQCRILDLGCLEGLFSLEFALHGCEVVGLEFREHNLAKARARASALNCRNVEFVQDNACNISIEKYGKFDAIICSGLLYHLTAADAVNLVNKMYEMSERGVIIDTHISLAPDEKYNGYAGHLFREHREGAPMEEKLKASWASADNETSFWFTRPSLVNLLMDAGFSSVYECFAPVHMNYGKPGFEAPDRSTFVAIKAANLEVHTTPSVNNLKERWPEGTLSYASNNSVRARGLFKSVLRKLF